MRVASLFALSCLLSITYTYNIALFAPYMANSQILWNKRVGEELSKAGHNVTIFILHMFEHENPKVDFDPAIHIVKVNASTGLNGTEILKTQSLMAFQDLPLWDHRMRKAMATFAKMSESCEVMIRNTALLDLIKASKFDIAFSHMYNFCSIGVIHITKIPTWIWLNSGALMDNVAESMGVPLPPSFCPPLTMDAGDSLTFIQRIKSFVGHGLFKLFAKKMVIDRENAVFRSVFGEDFPDLVDIAKKVPLVMVNSNELYDFPRPTLAKIVNIGGVGIKPKNAKNLTGDYAKLVDSAKEGVIVMSFGSVAPVYLMPQEWKEAYFKAFAAYPNVQFFMRHEYPDTIKDELPKNVYASKWLPQMDLLQHPKTLGLISHGGYNSIQDIIHAGVPMLATGLFGDQFRNAHMIERLKIGINMPKRDLNEENLIKNIGRLVKDKTLRESVKKLKEMVASKPIPVETLLVKWTEFVAQHKTLDNLVPAGNELNILVYHSVDVILFLFIVISIVLSLVFLLLRCCCRCVCRKICKSSCKSSDSSSVQKTKKNN